MHLTVTCQVVGYRSVADRKPCVDFSLESRSGGVENFRQFRALGGKWLSTLRCIQMRQMFVYWSTTTSRAASTTARALARDVTSGRYTSRIAAR